MSGGPNCTVYVGNLDERVSDRVLYDILIQAGRVVDLYIPRDKETDRPKGYAFAEYETEEIADYAVRLFSGLVTLYSRTLKFAISGKDKQSPNVESITPTLTLSHKSRVQSSSNYHSENSPHSAGLTRPSRFSAYPGNPMQAPVPYASGVIDQYNGFGSHLDGNNHEYGRRVYGAASDSSSDSRPHRYDTSKPISYPSYEHLY